jgi:hypothetical protein
MPPFIPVKNDDLTPKEQEALSMYTGGESLWINNYLREHNLGELNPRQKDKLRNYTVHLNNIINKAARSTGDTIVYRGAEAMDDKWKRLNKDDDLLFTQKGLISTSFNKDVALDFIEDDSPCCLLILRLPKNTKGLYISSESAFSDLDEDELLLPHGSRFQVTRRQMKKYGTSPNKIMTYYADLISQL